MYQQTAIFRATMLSFLAIAFLMLLPASAHAAATVGSILCAIYSIIAGDVGRGVATLAVASLGISALVGKVSWGMAIMVAVGIGVMFGAADLVSTVAAAPACGSP